MDGAYKFVCMDFSNKSCANEEYQKYLHKEELSRIERAIEKRKQEFLYGRLCAKAAYFQLVGSETDPAKICIRNDKAGAPFLDDGRCFVSITHDSGLSAAIVTNRENLIVGIDVQKIDPKRTETIVKFLEGNEKKKFGELAEKYGLDFTAYAFWTAKEAMSKLFGYGFSIYSALEIDVLEGTCGLSAGFRYLKNFKAVLRSYKDYFFAFAVFEKNAHLFTEENFEINVTEMDKLGFIRKAHG